jgi:Photosynthesis system II assembly factor YCF48
LSIPPTESVAHYAAHREGVRAATGTTSTGFRGWFAWPNLRWAAMAAAVVVVASVLVPRPGKQQQSMVDTVNQRAERIASSTDASAKPAAPLADRAVAPVAGTPAKPDNSLAREARASKMIAPQPLRAETRAATDSAAQFADKKRADSLENKRNFSFEADKLAVKVPAAPAASANGGIVASEQPAQTIGSSQETVVVNGAAADVVQPAPMEERGLTARNEVTPPIEKAKPAVKEEAQLKKQAQDSGTQNKLAAAYSNSDTAFGLQRQRSKQSKDVIAQWSLSQGRLQRSLDAGATWQIALQLQHPLLSFGARGSDVWAGGQSGTLFHSTDGGTTWTMVQPATKAGPLNSDIVTIEIRSAVEVVLVTSNNESWTTIDAGKTWDEK